MNYLSVLVISSLLLLSQVMQQPIVNSGSHTGSGPATIRDSNILTSTSLATLTIALPTGSAVGDLDFLFANGGNAPAGCPAGWTGLPGPGTSQWGYTKCMKVLASGDITTGTVSITYGGGGFDCVLAIVGFIGAPTYIETDGITDPTAGIASVGTIPANAVAIYWASGRAPSTGGVAPVITPLSGSPTSLKSATTLNGGSQLSYQVVPGGSWTVAINYAGSYTWVGSMIFVQ